MAVNLSPVGGVAAQFFTNNAVPLSGGKLYTYAAGTTTPQVAYTTSQGNIAWTNPIVLDAGGRVPGSGEVWLTDGLIYKFVLKDANDVLIATYDNITGINSNAVAYTNQQEIVTATANQTVFNLGISYQPGTNSLSVFVDGVNQYGPGAQYAYVETDSTTVTFASGLHVGAEVKFTTTQQQSAGAVDAEQVSYTPPFTGSVTTNVEAKLAQTVSVKDFGAVGNGVTDDYNAITDALAYLTSIGGGTLYFPQAKYACSGQIVWSNAPIILQGESNGLQPNTGTQIIFTTANSGGVNFKNGVNGKGHFSGIRDLWLKGSDGSLDAGWASGSSAGILAQAPFSTLENVHVSGFGGVGVYYLSGIGAPDVTINTNNCVAIKVRSSGNYANGWMTKGVDSNASTFIKVDSSSNGDWGIVEGSNIGNTYISPHVDGNTTGGINLPATGGGGAQMFGVYKETDTKPGIQIDLGNSGNHYIVCGTMDDSVVDNTADKTSWIIWPQGYLHSNKLAIGDGVRNSWTITDLLMLCQYGFEQKFYNADNSAFWTIQCLAAADNRLSISSAQGADVYLQNRLAATQLAATSAATSPTGGTGVVIGGTTSASANTGASGALPAQAAGYIVANINGTQVKIPYFAN